MPQSSEDLLTFRQLLDYCSTPESPHWQRAWRDFFSRYKNYIYKVVTNRCQIYKIPQIKRQFSDVVNDIVEEAILQLCKNDCRALQEYKARDSEKAFLSWLATISVRTTNDYVQKHFVLPIIRQDLQEFQNWISSVDSDVRWELYEDHVSKLREFHKKQKRNLERDIHIFKLYVWADFSTPMLTSIPCFRQIGHRVVDNVVNRMRKYLRQERNSPNF